MALRVLIIGKNSFLGRGIFEYLKNKNVNTSKISFKDFKKKVKFDQYSHVINCSITKKYILKKYNKREDIAFEIGNKLKHFKTKLLFLSTRKVYRPSKNLTETSILNPKCNYSKNNLITENKLINILGKKVIILRISNIIGLNKRNSNFKTYVQFFFNKIKKNIIFVNDQNDFKDFLSLDMFSKIIYKVLKKKNLFGVFNVSLGRKVFLNDINKWLNFYNKKKYKNKHVKIKSNSDNFYLNNKKICKEIRIKVELNNLRKDCLKISKAFFN